MGGIGPPHIYLVRMMLEEYIGKKVVVIKNDGFKKFGKLLSADQAFIRLQFLDGREEAIPLVVIGKIALDEM